MIQYFSDVLDKGFVRLVDYMGDDSSIVQAARISFNQGTKTPEADEALIRYMMRHQHMTPFEMCELKWHVKMPIFVARQWHRHRTASINEISGRYTEMEDEFYIPSSSVITKQNPTNKQGGTNEVIDNLGHLKDGFHLEQTQMYEGYKLKISRKMRKELARINLPLSLYTQFYWKVNLRNLFHFLSLRLDTHAQYEIRVYAEAMGNIVRNLFPIAYSCFEAYHLNSLIMTEYDVKALRLCSLNVSEEDIRVLFPTEREYSEFLEKKNKIYPS